MTRVNFSLVCVTRYVESAHFTIKASRTMDHGGHEEDIRIVRSLSWPGLSKMKSNHSRSHCAPILNTTKTRECEK